MKQPLSEIITRLEKMSSYNGTARRALEQLALAVSDGEKTEIINRLINEAYEFIQRASIWVQILEKHARKNTRSLAKKSTRDKRSGVHTQPL